MKKVEDQTVLAAAAWHRALGDPVDGPEQVVPDANADFFHSGGSSLTALQMVEEVEQQTGARLDLDLVLVDGTFGAFLKALEEAAPVD